MEWALLARKAMRVSPIALTSAFMGSLVLASGCARTWPSVRPLGDQDFLEAGGVRTIDVLPLDVGVAVSSRTGEDAELVADRFAARAAIEVFLHLRGRGYEAATIGPDGVVRRSDGQLVVAMSAEELEQVQASLAAFGTAQARVPHAVLTPYLPARLGAATAADATLYVGGWAYAGHDRRGVSAGDVAKVVLIGLLVVVVIAVAIATAKGGGPKLKGGGGGGGAAAVGSAAGRAVGAVGRGAARGLGRVARAGHHILRGFHHSPDAWGRSHTHINVYFAAPVPPPPESGPSRTFLEMTLVDNRRGVVLWHARQEFPASPARDNDVRDVVASVMAGLPASR